MTHQFEAASEEEMIAVGRRIASLLPRHCVALLTGRLGAGKTTLAKGIVSGLGCGNPEDVSSPTFTLIQEHDRVYHIDLYRLDTEREVETLGLEDLMARGDSVLLVEWGDRFRRWLPRDSVDIRIEDRGDDGREITLQLPGES